eukprot:PhF_6_TR31731/c0_g1_i1/m.46702
MQPSSTLAPQPPSAPNPNMTPRQQPPPLNNSSAPTPSVPPLSLQPRPPPQPQPTQPKRNSNNTIDLSHSIPSIPIVGGGGGAVSPIASDTVSEDNDETVMLRNPSDYPFPNFHPSQNTNKQQRARKQREASDVTHGLFRVLSRVKPKEPRFNLSVVVPPLPPFEYIPPDGVNTNREYYVSVGGIFPKIMAAMRTNGGIMEYNNGTKTSRPRPGWKNVYTSSKSKGTAGYCPQLGCQIKFKYPTM